MLYWKGSKNYSLVRILELFLVVFFFVIMTLSILYVKGIISFPWYGACSIYSTTGLLCPTCGGTTATASLLQGNVIKALKINLFVVVSYPLIIYYCLKGVYYVLSGNTLANLSINTKLIYFWCSFLVVFTILRNIL